MRNHRVPFLLGLMVLSGCTGPGAFHPIHLDELSRPRIRVVTAVGADREGPIDPKDRFKPGERVCVHATFVWMAGTVNAPVEIKLNCYREGVLVYTARTRTPLAMSPWHVWFDIPQGLMEAGTYRADVCAGDTVLDSHGFEIAAP